MKQLIDITKFFVEYAFEAIFTNPIIDVGLVLLFVAFIAANIRTSC